MSMLSNYVLLPRKSNDFDTYIAQQSCPRYGLSRLCSKASKADYSDAPLTIKWTTTMTPRFSVTRKICVYRAQYLQLEDDCTGTFVLLGPLTFPQHAVDSRE